MPPQGVGPGKCPTQHFLPTVSFFFFSSVRWCHSHQLSIATPWICASLPNTWVSLSCSSLSLFLTQLFYNLLPVLCRVDLHIQYVTEVFSIEPCCGSLLGESLSYHLLGRPARWIFRLSSWIWTSETRDGAAGRGALLVLWELSDVLWRVWKPVSSHELRKWVFMTRRYARFCFSNEKRLKHPVDSTSLEDIRKEDIRKSIPGYPFRSWEGVGEKEWVWCLLFPLRVQRKDP